jgi:hypothetical protein
MTTIKPMRIDEPRMPLEIEGDIRDFIRRDVTPLRSPQPEPASEFAVNNLNSLIQCVSGTSMQEIEKLIVELENAQDFLRNEGDRLQREISGYAQMSQATMKSLKIVAESIENWKKVVGDASARG